MTTLNTPNTLNLETVYIIANDSYENTVVFTESELPTIERLLASMWPGNELHVVGLSIVDQDYLVVAEVASPEDLAHEANRQLLRVGALSTDRIGLRDDIYAVPGTHDSTLILSDGTATIEGNAAEIIHALEALPVLAGMQAAWAALADFPVTCDCGCCIDCDTDTDTEPEHYEPSEAELEHWQNMCHEQYTGA